MSQKKFTREEVMEIIDILLQHPDALVDATDNEYTNWDAETLLELAEDSKVKYRTLAQFHPQSHT